MGYWWLMFICSVLLPLPIIFGGRMMWKHCPQKNNSVIGYCTSRSRKNLDTWKFANKHCGKLWWRVGWCMLILSVLAQLLVVDSSESLVYAVGVVVITIQVIILVVSIFLVEKALRNTFKKNGTRKENQIEQKWCSVIDQDYDTGKSPLFSKDYGGEYNMSQAINGMTVICGSDVPFSFEREKELLTVYVGLNGIEIPKGLDVIVGQKFGMLTGGRTLYKLSVPLSNDCIVFVDGQPRNVASCNQIRGVEYFLEDYEMGSKYTEMRLQFPELDYFLPSIGKAKCVDSDIVFSRVRDAIYSFDINYRDAIISVSFDRRAEAHSNVKTTAETISEVVLRFPETDDLEYINDLYITVRSFFAFICNRQNIGLRSAILIGNYPKKRIKGKEVVDEPGYTKQKLFLSQKYLEPMEDMKQIKKVPNGALFAGKLKELLQLFFEEKDGEIAVVNGSGIHPSFKYRNLIDLEQSLHITAAFEYYVRTLLPEISSQETLDFVKDIEALVDGYIETVTGKKKKKARDFKKSLKPQISLEDKVLKVFGGYLTWQPLASILSEWFGDDISELANAANLWRNELAHEKREYNPDVNVVHAIRLVEHMNYCIVLRCAGYSDEEIKFIISEVLTR